MNQLEFQSTILRQLRAMREETRLNLVQIQYDLDETKLHITSINERLDSLTSNSLSRTVRKPPQSMTGRDVNVAFWVHQQIEKENAKPTNGKKLLVFDDDIPWDTLNSDAKRCVGALMALHLEPGWESLTWANIYRMQPKNAERVIEAAGRKPEMAVFSQCAYNWGIRAICEQKQKSTRRTATKGKNGQRMKESNQEQVGNRYQADSEVQQPRTVNVGRFGSNIRSQALKIRDPTSTPPKVLADGAQKFPVEINPSTTTAIYNLQSVQSPFNHMRTENRPTFEPVPPISSRLRSDLNHANQGQSSMSPAENINAQVPIPIQSPKKQGESIQPLTSMQQHISSERDPLHQEPFSKRAEDEIDTNANNMNEINARNLSDAAILAANKSLFNNHQNDSLPARERVSAPTPDPFHSTNVIFPYSESNGFNRSSAPNSNLESSCHHFGEAGELSQTTATQSNNIHDIQSKLIRSSASLQQHEQLSSSRMNAGLPRTNPSIRSRGRRGVRGIGKRGLRRR